MTQASPAVEPFAERVTNLLLELSGGHCSITEEMVEAESDPTMGAILLGLLMLWEDLKYQEERRSGAEVELKARGARLQALFDLARVSIWDCDLSEVMKCLRAYGSKLDATLARQPSLIRELAGGMNLREVNSHTLSTFGAKDLDHFQQQLGTIFTDASLPMLWQLWGALARGETQVELEGMLQSLDGRPIHVVFGVSLQQDQGEGAIITVSDVTPMHEARRAAEALARVRADELDHVNSEVERLFYAVSHDLRAPLRGVENLAEWALEDMAEGSLDDVKKHIQQISGRVSRLDRMLNDLLSYAKVGRAQESQEMVVVGSLMEDLKSNLVSLPAGFELRWTSLPTFITQRTLLAHVFMNLISNAIKHHDRKQGVVEVSFSEQGDSYEFQVRDDGPGIPEKYREKVFALFSTLRRRDEVEGSGMGLAFVKKVVRKQGGDVRIKATSGRGATFAFTWPKALRG